MVHIWPLIVYSAAALAVLAGMLAVSAVLGQRHREGATDEPYESGIAATGYLFLAGEHKINCNISLPFGEHFYYTAWRLTRALENSS